MQATLNALSSLRAWQIGVLVAVLAVGFGASFGIYLAVGGSGGGGLAENQRLIPVQSGNLVNSVSINGTITFPVRESLAFGSQGTVEELLVVEGQDVTEGQPLARLDSETLAELEAAVAQARVDLQKAQDALANAQDPYSPVELAQAEVDVSSSAQKLEEAQSALDSLLAPTQQVLAGAQAAVLDARGGLEAAQEALERLLQPTSLDISLVEADVAEAKLRLQAAGEDLDRLLDPTAHDIAEAEAKTAAAALAAETAGKALESLRGGATSEEIDLASSTVATVRTTLAGAEQEVALAGQEWDDRLDSATDALGAAGKDYIDALNRWLGASLKVEALASPDELLNAWGTTLQSLFEPGFPSYEAISAAYESGDFTDDPATPWSEPIIIGWLFFYPGAISATCEGGVDSDAICVQQELDDVWETYAQAQTDLGRTRTDSAKAIAGLDAARIRASQDLTDAEEALDLLTSGPDALALDNAEKSLALALEEMEVAEADLASLVDGPDDLDAEKASRMVGLARAELDEAEEALAQLTNRPDDLDLEERLNAVEVARADLDAARERFASLVNQADSLDVKAQQGQVAVYRAQLDEAEEALQQSLLGGDPLEVSLREAQAVAAQEKLDSALRRLDSAVLTAPWDGVASFVGVEEGDIVGPTTRAIELVDPTIVEVAGVVDEIDVLFIQLGARAPVTIDALLDQELQGTVSFISATADNQQGVVTYQIRIQVTLPDGLDLREGLNAVASVPLSEESGLLVPNQTVLGSFDEPYVQVWTDGAIEQRPVELGAGDDFWTVVRAGLFEGEQVVMDVQASDAGEFTDFGRLRGVIGTGGFRQAGGPGEHVQENGGGGQGGGER